jgi:hypothetical protein
MEVIGVEREALAAEDEDRLTPGRRYQIACHVYLDGLGEEKERWEGKVLYT